SEFRPSCTLARRRAPASLSAWMRIAVFSRTWVSSSVDGSLSQPPEGWGKLGLALNFPAEQPCWWSQEVQKFLEHLRGYVIGQLASDPSWRMAAVATVDFVWVPGFDEHWPQVQYDVCQGCQAGLTSFTSVGPGGCSSDCSCPTFPVVTCEAERSIAATATASLQWWWSLTLISLVVNLIVIGFLWVSLPYICVGAFESKRSPIISFVGEVKAEQKIDKGGLGAAVTTGKGGRRTMASCLNIPETQILVNYPGDADGLFWHWRVLFHKVNEVGRWIIGTPDEEVYEENFVNVDIRPLARGAAYPADIFAETYAPETADMMIGGQGIAAMRVAAQGRALVFGLGPVAAAAVTLNEGRWLIADVDHKDFGNEIAEGELLDPARTVTLVHGAEEKKLHVFKDKVVTLERVIEVDVWKQSKRPGLPGGSAGDLRLLGNQVNGANKRVMGLSRALELMTEHRFDDWPHKGPKAVREFLESVLEAGGDLQVYHGHFVRKSGLAENSACSHELKSLLGILRLGLSYDQVDIGNLASFEAAVRRIIEIQHAVRRNPQHPVFDGLDQSTIGSVDSVGGARAAEYGQWLSDQQKSEAKFLKNQREFRDEQAAERKKDSGGGSGRGEGRGDGQGRGRGKKKEKGGGPAAAGAVAAVAAGSLGLTGSSGKGGFNSNPCMYGDGRNHGDPFPMSVPSVKPPGLDWDRTSASNGGVRRGEARSKAIRLSESISSLNALACSTAHGIRGSREKFFKTPASPPAGYSSGQLSVLGRAVEKIERYGPCPGGLTPRECFGEIIRSTDGYSMESKNVAPYQPELLKVLKDGGAYPKPAVGLLPPEVARALQEPQTFMIRSEEEMQRWRSSNPSFMPHWDETLKQSRSKRLELYKSLHAKGLLTYRRKIRSKCGIFFVWKSSKKGIRMIVDARMTNAFFRRPPRTRLGGGGALATLDTYLSDEEWAELKEEAGCFSEEPELEGATGDVQDAYFQYDLDELAEWFGFDDPFSAEELGVTFLQGEAVEEHERLFPCMRAMSQGWSWALHFCQAAVRHKMALGLGEEGRLVEEGLPAPSMLHGPVGSVYVDNLAVLGHVAEEVKDTFARVKGELVAVGFSLHELSEGEALIQNVGLVIDKVGQKLRHKNFRAWRLYLGLKYLLTLKKITGEVLRMFLGHIVHYCTLMRPALSILVHSYAVAFSSLGKTVKFPACVKSELRLFMGLIFVAEVNLAAPHSEEMGCGDASGRGYAFMTSRVSLEESRELHRHNERWRFIEVEVDRGGPGALQPEGWTADFEVAPSAYGNWMLQQAGLPAEGSGVLEQGPLNRKEKVRLKSRRIIKEFELVGSVPRLPEAVCEETRWRTIKEGRWNRNEAIHLKEGRVALMSLRRQSRVVRNHGKRFLTLNDNLSSLLAQAKGRAKRYDLTALCRRSAALQLGCDIPWHQRYIESERNPADAGSRRFVESRQQQGKEQGSSKQKDFLDRELHSRGDSEDRSGSLESPLKVMVGSSHFASTVDAQGRSCAGSKASTSKTALGPQATWGLREVNNGKAFNLSNIKESPNGTGRLRLLGSTPLNCVTSGLTCFCQSHLLEPHSVTGNQSFFRAFEMKSEKSLGLPSRSSGSVTSLAQGTGSHRGPTQSIRGARKTIAKERATKVDTEQAGFLRNRTVRNQTTRELYCNAVAKFTAFALTLGAILSCIEDVDRALEKYFETLFIQGSSQYVASCTLCGWAFLNPAMSTKPRHHFPLSKAALKGWKNLEPGGSKDPCPFEVCLMIAGWFLDKGYKHWSLVLSPSVEGVPTKVGEFDDSLIVGSKGREWISKVLEKLWRHSNPNATLFSFSLREIETQFRNASAALGLGLLKLSPHTLRHGGPSHDIYFELRSLAEVQRRGCWKALASVKRYEKHACLQRQLNKLTAAQQLAARQASLSVPARLLRMLG
ncbi:unnamed protein product, partial [Polarella glacialis]